MAEKYIKKVYGFTLSTAGEAGGGGGGGGSTDLTWVASPSGVTIVNSTGNDAVGTLVDGTNWGLVSPAMKSTWDNAENNAKAYADSLIVGLWNDRGSYNASGGNYPSTGGSGTAGAIRKGDIWTVSVAGTLPTGQVVEIGDVVRALVNGATNIQADWAITQNNIGYTAENSVNKSDSYTVSSSTTYASTKALVDGLATKGDVLTSGSYSNPSWITDLAFSKISSLPTTLAGYGITDAWKQGGNALTSETIFGGISGAFGVDFRTNNVTALKLLTPPTGSNTHLTFESVNASTSTHAYQVAVVSSNTDAGLTFKQKGAGGIRLYCNGAQDSYLVTDSTGSGGVRVIISSTERFRLQATTIGIPNILYAFAGGTMSIGTNGNPATTGTITPVRITGHTAGGGYTATTSTLTHLEVGAFQANPWAVTNNTASLKFISLIATINQTGTSTGYIRGIDFTDLAITSVTGQTDLIKLDPTITANTGTFSLIRSGLNTATGLLGLNFTGTIKHYLAGNTSIGTTTSTAFLTLGASTTAQASLRILAGTAPTTPNEGDIWQDGTNIKIYIGGATKTFTIV